PPETPSPDNVGADPARPQGQGGASAAPTTAIDTPSRDDIARALQIVKTDPNLATDRTIKSLRWRDSAAPQKPSPTPRWALWIAGLFRWFNESARWLMWCTIAGLAALLVVFILRLVRGAELPLGEKSF